MILELSGNPIAVLENVGESQDIAVQPGAVWELPERARAYLLDLLQGGGVKLHVDYVDLIYRTLHDLGESPRTAFGENRQGLSGVALNVEMDPLLKKVQRKRLIRSAAYRKRNEMVLRILEQFSGVSYAPYRSRIVWGPRAAARTAAAWSRTRCGWSTPASTPAAAPPTSWAWRTRRRSSAAGRRSRAR